jgi:biopolymer transport protein ExbD/biopolymer transport protein TolR
MVASSSQRQVFNEINITPLTDIFLVLLIIMMVVAPMMRQMRQDILPPEIAAGQPASQDRLTVEIATNGDLFLDGEPIANSELTDALTAWREAITDDDDNATADDDGDTRKGVLIVRADQTTQSGEVLKVFDSARDAGFLKLVISGLPASSQQPGTQPAEEGGGDGE